MKNLIEKYKGLFFELMRFGIVGGVSFVFDWGTLMLVLHLVLGGEKTSGTIAIATAAGFIVGVTVNYILSVLFVFKNAREGAGKGVRAMTVFLAGAVVGLLLTQAIMNFGTIQLGYNETLVKIGATLIVMVWNYVSRKLLIFRSE